jgi:CrcB protein
MVENLWQYLWIGLGGFVGANARYLAQRWTANQWGADFPYGTMLANVSGSFVIGFFLTLAAGRFNIAPQMRLLVAVGFLGGFTTFSSFSFETLRLFEQGGWWLAVLNFFGNTVLGLLGVMVGIFLAQWLQKGGV